MDLNKHYQTLHASYDLHLGIEKNIVDFFKNEYFMKIGISTMDEDEVGLIALKDIPENTDLMVPWKFDKVNDIFNKNILKDLHPNIQKVLIQRGGIPNTSKLYISVSKYSKDHLPNYINHSDEANVIYSIKDNLKDWEMVTQRKIETGEEITVNYNDNSINKQLVEWKK